MKVVYNTIMDAFAAAKRKAEAEGRVIKYIELTRDEWAELRSSYKLSYDVPPQYRHDFLGVYEDVFLYADESWPESP